MHAAAGLSHTSLLTAISVTSPHQSSDRDTSKTAGTGSKNSGRLCPRKPPKGDTLNADGARQ